MPAEIPVDLALRVAERRASERGYALILPDSPYRTAVVYGLAGAHELTGTGWDYERAQEGVSVTLPGAGPLVDLLAKVPYVGSIFAGVASRVQRPTVCLAPSAVRTGSGLLGVVFHEEGHVGDIRRGGLLWCLAYGLVGEVKAGAEAPCYGAADVAIRHEFEGVPLEVAEADALASLAAYGLGDDGMALARGILRSSVETLRAGGDPGGILAEVRRELAREGWHS